MNVHKTSIIHVVLVTGMVDAKLDQRIDEPLHCDNSAFDCTLVRSTYFLAGKTTDSDLSARAQSELQSLADSATPFGFHRVASCSQYLPRNLRWGRHYNISSHAVCVFPLLSTETKFKKST